MIADMLLNSAIWPFRFISRRFSAAPDSIDAIQPEAVQQILLIRTAYIGDVIMTLPMLKPLKALFPRASITMLTSQGASQLLWHNPYIKDILVYDPFWFYPASPLDYLRFWGKLRQRRFDLVIEARADIRDILLLALPARSQLKLSYAVGGGASILSHVAPYEHLKHKVEYHLDLARFLGCNTNDADWNIYLTEHEQRQTDQLLCAHGVHAPFMCVHPGGRLPLKRWPLQRYADLCDRIMDCYNIPVVLLAAKPEMDITEEISRRMRHHPVSLAGKTDLRQLSGVILKSSFMVCNDSAPMHIAAALKKPVIAVFGPSNSFETGPWGKGHRVVEKKFSCRYSCDESQCHNPSFHACMEAIPVDDVFDAVVKHLKKSGVTLHG